MTKTISKSGQKHQPSIVGLYKLAVSKNVHRLEFDFTWQSRFN